MQLNLTYDAFGAESLPILRVIREREIQYNPRVPNVSTPENAISAAQAVLKDADRECLIVLLLDTRHKLIGCNIASIGTLDSSLAHPREIFKAAILANAKAIVLCHNHPSGEATPSPEDIRLTQKVIDAGHILGLPLLDHVIIGDAGRYTSLRQTNNTIKW